MSKSILLLLVSGVAISFAQDPGTPTSPPAAPSNAWKIEHNSTITLTLNTYSDNWAGGDAGSVSWASQITELLEKQLTPTLLNQNKIRLAFGQTETQGKETGAWSPPQKSTDLIDMETILKLALGLWVDPYISIRGISQFMDMRDSLLTRYVNPWDLSETFGASRTLVKGERVNWNARLGLGARQTIDRKKLEEGSLTSRSTDVRHEGGAELVSEFKAVNAAKWLTYTSQFKLFEAVLSSKADETALPGHKNDWRYPDMNWENILTMNVTKYIMINYYTQLLYDREVKRDLRLKQTLSLGLTYTFKK